MKHPVYCLHFIFMVFCGLTLTGCFDSLSSATELISSEEADYSTDFSGTYFMADEKERADKPVVIKREKDGFKLFSSDPTAEETGMFFRLSPLKRARYYVLQLSLEDADKTEGGVNLYLARREQKDLHIQPLLPSEFRGDGCGQPPLPEDKNVASFCRALDRHGFKVSYSRSEYLIQTTEGEPVSLAALKNFVEELLDTVTMSTERLSLLREDRQP